ncbi:hypothetical protein LX36DRAFT_671382 [Colletotrichum falcatum]|nr:hypothetical protein LX36DRAFT_671382 [Colletotrichum falcatum]
MANPPLYDIARWQSWFAPLVARLAPSSSTIPDDGRPTLSRYLFPPHFVCGLDAADEVPRPHEAETREHGWADPALVVEDAIVTDPDQWAKSYHPSDVEIMHNRSEDVLIKRPIKVIVDGGIGCYFKRFGTSFGPAHAKKELTTLKAIAMARILPPPP